MIVTYLTSTEDIQSPVHCWTPLVLLIFVYKLNSQAFWRPLFYCFNQLPSELVDLAVFHVQRWTCLIWWGFWKPLLRNLPNLITTADFFKNLSLADWISTSHVQVTHSQLDNTSSWNMNWFGWKFEYGCASIRKSVFLQSFSSNAVDWAGQMVCCSTRVRRSITSQSSSNSCRIKKHCTRCLLQFKIYVTIIVWMLCATLILSKRRRWGKDTVSSPVLTSLDKNVDSRESVGPRIYYSSQP